MSIEGPHIRDGSFASMPAVRPIRSVGIAPKATLFHPGSEAARCQTRKYQPKIAHASRGITWHNSFKDAAKFCLFRGEL